MKEIGIGQAPALTSPNPLVLVCTEKENGQLNMAPVSFVMFAAFKPPMLAFAMGMGSTSGENIRRTGKAVIAVPGAGIEDEVMEYGSCHGKQVDKLSKHPIPLQALAGTSIQIPQNTRVAFSVSLDKTVEAGDHYLYLCNIEKVFADEAQEGLFAWNGYNRAAPAVEK